MSHGEKVHLHSDITPWSSYNTDYYLPKSTVTYIISFSKLGLSQRVPKLEQKKTVVDSVIS